MSDDARERALQEMKDELMRDELPRIVRTMRILGIGPDELAFHLAGHEPTTSRHRGRYTMRTSQRALLAVGGVLAGLVVVTVLAFARYRSGNRSARKSTARRTLPRSRETSSGAVRATIAPRRST